MPKTVVVIRHLMFEDVGCFAPVLEASGYELRYADAGIDALSEPMIERADVLIVLGGPIGAIRSGNIPFWPRSWRCSTSVLSVISPPWASAWVHS